MLFSRKEQIWQVPEIHNCYSLFYSLSQKEQKWYPCNSELLVGLDANSKMLFDELHPETTISILPGSLFRKCVSFLETLLRPSNPFETFELENYGL